MTEREKYMAVLLMFVMWGGLVYLGLTPAAGLIQAMRDCLIGLGIFQAALTVPTVK